MRKLRQRQRKLRQRQSHWLKVTQLVSSEGDSVWASNSELSMLSDTTIGCPWVVLRCLWGLKGLDGFLRPTFLSINPPKQGRRNRWLRACSLFWGSLLLACQPGRYSTSEVPPRCHATGMLSQVTPHGDLCTAPFIRSSQRATEFSGASLETAFYRCRNEVQRGRLLLS